MNVVSLLPSATEIVYALGIEPVGVSHECDYPPEASEKPAINRVRIDPDAGSGKIHEQVLEAERGGGVYEIDLGALARAAPDLIVTQGICDVCAVDHVLVEDAVAELGLDAEILTVDPHGIGDVIDDIERVGQATGRDDRAAEVVAEMRERIEAVRERAEAVEVRPRVAVFDWMDPVMVAGHWVPELVEMAGGRYEMTEPGAHARPREWAEVRAYDPEIAVVAPCGFGLDQIRENLADLTAREGWADLAAVRRERAYALDGHHYVNRPGPRLVDTLEHLAGLIHPERFETPPPEVSRPVGELVVEG